MSIGKVIGRGLGYVMLAGISGSILLLLNHNVAWQRTPPAQLTMQINQAIANSTTWLAARTRQVTVEQPNLVLLHMVDDMAAMSDDPLLRLVLDTYLAVPSQSLWRRLAARHAIVRAPPQAELAYYEDYQRWIAHGLAPQLVPLTPADHAAMFAPDQHHWGSLTHQLIAVLIDREYQGASAESNTLINHLSERIAFEAMWDVRVTDLYLQRLAVLLAAGRPDLVKRRWVERLLSHQKPDGGWISSWHGWGPDILAFYPGKLDTNAHTTIQGMWTLYMLKYRYPQWREQ